PLIRNTETSPNTKINRRKSLRRRSLGAAETGRANPVGAVDWVRGATVTEFIGFKSASLLAIVGPIGHRHSLPDNWRFRVHAGNQLHSKTEKCCSQVKAQSLA